MPRVFLTGFDGPNTLLIGGGRTQRDADLVALARVLYLALAGRPPARGWDRPDPIPGLPWHVDRVWRAWLLENRAATEHSAWLLGDDCGLALEGLPPREKSPARRRRRRSVETVIPAVILVGVVVAGFMDRRGTLFGSDQPEPAPERPREPRINAAERAELALRHYEHSLDYYEQEDFTRATVEVTKAVEYRAEWYEALLHLARCLRRSGEPDRALDAIHLAKQAQYQNAEALLEEALLWIELRDPDRALGVLDRALKQDELFGEAALTRARLHLQLGNHRQARADLTLAIDLNVERPACLVDRARTWLADGHVAEALADYDAAVALLAGLPSDAARAELLNARAVLHKRQGNRSQCRADLARALEYDLDNSEAWYNQGNLRMEDGDLDGALADLENARRCDPRFAPPYGAAGMIYCQRAQWSEAREALTGFLALTQDHPMVPRARALLAECDRQLGHQGR